jgi:hypothetical protein
MTVGPPRPSKMKQTPRPARASSATKMAISPLAHLIPTRQSGSSARGRSSIGCGKMNRCEAIAGWVTALALLFCTETSAIAQGTDQQREACTPDAFRLCGTYIPDSDRVTACLRGNGPRLSAPCHDVFFPPQVANPRRRSQGRPYPGDDD